MILNVFKLETMLAERGLGMPVSDIIEQGA